MKSLSGRKVLIVEDEYFIADDLVHQVTAAGADIVGPASTIDSAFALLAASPVDLAILDINLKGDIDFSLADELSRRNIPFVFATGYDATMIPAQHAKRPRWQKPFDVADLVAGASPRDVRSWGMDLTSLSSPPRRRASHIGHVHNRAARLAVRDIQEHLSEWQHTVATLRAVKLFGAHRSNASERAAQLIPLVLADRIELDTRLHSLEPAVASHSLPRDIRRALDRLHDDLRQLIDS